VGRNVRLVLAIAPMILLQGCVASMVSNVVTAPVKIVSRTTDILTTSQSESDEKRGRDMRKREENVGKLSRQLKKVQERCADGDRDACKKARDIRDQIEDERSGG
jgi:predicted Holliday junction resolvase-like endonuclease